MKRAAVAALAVALTLSLTACEPGDEKPADPVDAQIKKEGSLCLAPGDRAQTKDGRRLICSRNVDDTHQRWHFE